MDHRGQADDSCCQLQDWKRGPSAAECRYMTEGSSASSLDANSCKVRDLNPGMSTLAWELEVDLLGDEGFHDGLRLALHQEA